MKRSKIFLLIAIAILLGVNASGQYFGVKAGWHQSSMLILDTEVAAPYDPRVYDYGEKFGYQLGGTIEMPLFSVISLESGIYMVNRGLKITYIENFGGTDLISHEKRELYYFDLPLTAKISIDAGKGNIFASGGAYFSYGIFGKSSSKITFGEIEEAQKRDIRWGSQIGADDYLRPDYGFVFSAGIEVNSFNMGITYSLGQSSISPEKAYGSVNENRLLGVTVGYTFGKMKKTEKPEMDQEAARIKKTIKQKTDSNATQRNEALRIEKQVREKHIQDSITAAKAEIARLSLEKHRADSLLAIKIREKHLASEKAIADSITSKKQEIVKQDQNSVIYKVQFASNVSQKGSYTIKVGGRFYKTWEYQYSSAFRQTVGEFRTLSEAAAFQNLMRKEGFTQAFVVAFRNNKRTTDPNLFR